MKKKKKEKKKKKAELVLKRNPLLPGKTIKELLEEIDEKKYPGIKKKVFDNLDREYYEDPQGYEDQMKMVPIAPYQTPHGAIYFALDWPHSAEGRVFWTETYNEMAIDAGESIREKATEENG